MALVNVVNVVSDELVCIDTDNVEISINEDHIHIKGPKGELTTLRFKELNYEIVESELKISQNTKSELV